MLSELLRYLNNYFEEAKYFGEFVISGNKITSPDFSKMVQEGQYFRIVDSVFNDGVYSYPAALKDETFDGAVWTLRIPQEIIDISREIDEWKAKYAGVDSAAMGPYASESFGGYSYSKGTSADGKLTGGDWRTVAGFTARLDTWRKPRCRY